MAKQLEKLGTHFLAIKDMAGLCKPYAAFELVKTLRDEIGIPIHFHTHDSPGNQIASIACVTASQCTAVDVTVASNGGATS